MTRTRKNLKILFVKFFGKIGGMLVANLAYVIVHHLKSVCCTVCMGYFFNLNSCYRDKKKKFDIFSFDKSQFISRSFSYDSREGEQILKKKRTMFLTKFSPDN